MACHGNGFDHCCYVPTSSRVAPEDGSLGTPGQEVCRFLELDTVPGRHWVCGLRRELGSWDAVHADPDYLEHVKPVWERTGTSDCGDFGPAEGQCCFAGDG